MTWLAIAWKFLRGIPWQVWAIAAVIGAAWYYGEVRADQREESVRAEYQSAQNKADAKAKAAEEKRDKAAANTNATAAGKGSEASASTRAETAAAVERVNHETAKMVVPANCPTGLPASVSNEGRAAVERARAAGHRMRTGGNG